MYLLTTLFFIAAFAAIEHMSKFLENNFKIKDNGIRGFIIVVLSMVLAFGVVYAVAIWAVAWFLIKVAMTLVILAIVLALLVGYFDRVEE